MSNSNSKTLPFSTEQLLKAVDESAKRSRSILLMLTFTSFLVAMALVNSLVPKFNWFKSKIEISKNMLHYIVLPTESFDKTNLVNKFDSIKPMDKLSDYIIANEKYFNKGSVDSSVYKYAVSMDRQYPVLHNFKIQNPFFVPVLFDSFQSRCVKYDEIGKSLRFMYLHNVFERQSLLNIISTLDDALVEHLDLIRVPILGVSFHVNYLGVYSGLLLMVLLILFYFSLLREKINLKITFKRGWIDLKHHHYYLYEYASMLQVLSIPKSLFTYRRKKNFTYILFSKTAIFLPLITYASLFFYDFSTVDIGSETNFYMTGVTIGLSLLFLVAIGIYSKKVSEQWSELDILWDNQAYEFNLEYIFEAIGEDKEVDLIDLFPPSISKKDMDNVKYLWYCVVRNKFRKGNIISLRDSERLLSEFVNSTFKGDFNENDQEITVEQINEVWDPLIQWFNSKGKKNVHSNFRTSFRDTVNGLHIYFK